MFFKKDIEIEELQYRMLILEKRLEEYRRENKRLVNAAYEMIKELEKTKVNKRSRKEK